MSISHSIVACLTLLVAPLVAAATESPPRVLVFSRTLGYRHDSITNGIAAIRNLGVEHHFTVEATEDAGAFTATNLIRYQAVVLLSVTGDVWDSAEQTALKEYIEGGGGVAAIHGAIFGPLACEEKWAWYGELFCCAFTNHCAVQSAMVELADSTHPSTAGLPAHWRRTDEWYNFTGTPRGCARILATVDESTYQGGTMGQDHPIAWCRRVGKGRLWYTAMGHTGSSYAEPLFLRHLYGGIQYALNAPVEPAAAAPSP
jgi:type 1 glutamine amidotransferase